MQKTVSISVDKRQLPSVLDRLRKGGLEETSLRSPYEQARFIMTNCTVIAYTSGKIVVQGKSIDKAVGILSGISGVHVSEIGKESNPATPINRNGQELTDTTIGGNNVVQRARSGTYSSDPTTHTSNYQNWTPRIGSDEVGKGDYFGPMVVAACYVDEMAIDHLNEIGITDSKKLTDIKILDIFSQIKDLLIYEVEVLHPSEYNFQHLRTKNVAVMLAKLHDTVLSRTILRVENEKRPLEKVVIDQFSASSKRLTNELSDVVKRYPVEQFHKGESDPSVATASVIARAFFLREWDQMEKKYDMDIPKGATNVIHVAKAFVDRYGADELSQVAKVSFKTTKKVLS